MLVKKEKKIPSKQINTGMKKKHHNFCQRINLAIKDGHKQL